MRQGTGVGNPLADLLFIVAFSLVIRRLRAELAGIGVCSQFSAAGARNFLGIAPELLPGESATEVDVANLSDVSSSDDLAFVVTAIPSRIIDVVQRAGNVAWKVYAEAGFRLDFGPNKTAVVIE